ncbi:unnamed protein product [Thelazia callipaeda]|uniref:Nuclear receptor domain-containing protein n=1 Tax=Thelazia callipaeda TaxID=103827 RepID=A0A158RAX2_THECL|nr:unnamed protein product [Thelazia callipaeda]
MPMIKEVMFAASTANAYPFYNIKDKPSDSGSAVCAVCGDGHAKLHYGILACYGCKGFFRRTLTGKYRYVCRFGNNCIVDKYQRNSCRYCRFQRCLEVGMDPKAVRPDRDLTGRQRVPRLRKRQIDEELLNHVMRLQDDDWSRKLPVESRVLLMQLMNIESKVAQREEASSVVGNVSKNAAKTTSLRELFEKRPIFNSRQTEMRYEPHRMVQVDELPQIAHGKAVAAVDWVHSLAELAGITNTDDKVALVKSCYSSLTIFNFSARTAQNTSNTEILCLCNFSYVPRKLPSGCNQANHLSEDLVDRTLNELVAPLRKLNIKDEEVVPLKAVIILNPNAKGLSRSTQQVVSDLRDRVQEMFFQVVKELHPIHTAIARFGNLLLLLPTIMALAGIMTENLQIVRALTRHENTNNLLGEIFDEVCVKLDEPVTSTSSPILENPAEISLQCTSSSKSVLNITEDSKMNRDKSKMDSSTQTDLDATFKRSLSSITLYKTLTSPCHNLLDDEPTDYSPPPDYNDCNDLFFLMDDIR